MIVTLTTDYFSIGYTHHYGERRPIFLRELRRNKRYWLKGKHTVNKNITTITICSYHTVYRSRTPGYRNRIRRSEFRDNVSRRVDIVSSRRQFRNLQRRSFTCKRIKRFYHRKLYLNFATTVSARTRISFGFWDSFMLRQFCRDFYQFSLVNCF